ncbi:GEM-like protein 4 [Fagus crenata]
MNKLGKKAENLAHGVREHVRLRHNITETVKGKLSLGAQILQVGSLEKVFKNLFSVSKGQKLLKASQRYLSTTAGPIAGLLFISTNKISFCSERSIKFASPNGELIRLHYMVVWVKCRKEIPTHVLDTYCAAFSLLLYEDVDLLVKHISKWPAETQEAKDIAMVLQHAREINRIDVLVWHNVSNNITNNPPQAQAPGCGRGRGRGCGRGRGHGRGGGRGHGSRCMNVDPSTSTQLTPSTGDGPSVAPSTSAQPPPPTNVDPSSTPFSFAQPPPPTSINPSSTPSIIAQPPPPTSVNPSSTPSSIAQPPPPTSVDPSGTPYSIAQLTPSTNAHPSNDVTSSTRKRYKVAPSSPLPISPDSALLTTTHLPPLPEVSS